MTKQEKLPGVKNNPMKQKTIDGKAILHQTPPKECLDAAEFFFSKKEDLNACRKNLNRANEELIMTMKGTKINSLLIGDPQGGKKRITLCESSAKLKVSKA